MNIYITDEDYEIAEKRGIKPKTLYARVHEYLWDKDEALSKPVVDEEYRYWLNIAKENNIIQSTFSYRIHKKKMSYEQAATTPLSKRGRKKGVRYESNRINR